MGGTGERPGTGKGDPSGITAREQGECWAVPEGGEPPEDMRSADRGSSTKTFSQNVAVRKGTELRRQLRSRNVHEEFLI